MPHTQHCSLPCWCSNSWGSLDVLQKATSAIAPASYCALPLLEATPQPSQRSEQNRGSCPTGEQNHFSRCWRPPICQRSCSKSPGNGSGPLSSTLKPRFPPAHTHHTVLGLLLLWCSPAHCPSSWPRAHGRKGAAWGCLPLGGSRASPGTSQGFKCVFSATALKKLPEVLPEKAPAWCQGNAPLWVTVTLPLPFAGGFGKPRVPSCSQECWGGEGSYSSLPLKQSCGSQAFALLPVREGLVPSSHS